MVVTGGVEEEGREGDKGGEAWLYYWREGEDGSHGGKHAWISEGRGKMRELEDEGAMDEVREGGRERGRKEGRERKRRETRERQMKRG